MRQVFGNVELIVQETEELKKSVAGDLELEEKNEDERNRAIASNTVRSQSTKE
jgi:hypothetical protein